MAVVTGRDHWLATGLLLSHIAFFGWASWRCGGSIASCRSAPVVTIVLDVTAALLSQYVATRWATADRSSQSARRAYRFLENSVEVISGVDYARFVADTVVQLVAVPLGILTMSMHGGSKSEEARRHICSVTAGRPRCFLPGSGLHRPERGVRRHAALSPGVLSMPTQSW